MYSVFVQPGAVFPIPISLSPDIETAPKEVFLIHSIAHPTSSKSHLEKMLSTVERRRSYRKQRSIDLPLEKKGSKRKETKQAGPANAVAVS